MRTLLLAGAAAFSLTALPAALSAQDSSATVAADATLTVEQQATYDAWTAEQRAYFDTLDRAHRDYFWTLTPRQRESYWVLTPEQRGQVFGMTPEARANAWTSIEAQLAAGANNSDTSVAARTGGELPRTAAEANRQAMPAAPSTRVVAGTAPGAPDTVVTTHPGNLAPPPAQAMNRNYPVCRGAVQDSCQNPGEGGAPGVSRALSYWPGDRDDDTDSGG